MMNREVLNVLTFSLNTAEQSLVELQPQVVAKLIEGRNRRIQMLEQSYKGKLKDVDQRSAETCAVNSQHLEQFQKKASENEKNAKEMSKSAVTELLRLLQVSTT
jgi:F0F1-type ATP synthase membrane subunit b/b'